MAEEIDILVVPGPVMGIPVPVTTTDQTLLTGHCELMGWSLREASGDTARQNQGSVLSPAAGANITSISTPLAGTYDVFWEVTLDAAATATDLNNFKLKNGVTQIASSVNPGAGGAYPQPSIRVTMTGAASLTITAGVAGTVGATYSASISIVPVNATDAAIELQDVNQVLGEASMAIGASSTEVMPGDGLHVNGQILLHVVQGTVTGVVYARFPRGTG